jgi:hypothetical protein
MKRLLLLIPAVLALFFASPKGAAAQGANDNILARRYYFPVDSLVLARVDDRVVTCFDFRKRWFDVDPRMRIGTDSAGRFDFMNTLVDREVMGLTALQVKRPLNFEDRLEMRRQTNTVLQNVLYQRLVVDSIQISETDLESVMKQYAYDQHLRSLLFRDRATAERVRRELLGGKTTWASAAKRSTSPDSLGDLGWVDRTRARGELAIKTFRLEPGAYSEVFLVSEGYRLYQALERRPAKRFIPKSFSKIVALEDLRALHRAPHVQRFNDAIRRFGGVVYDTANIEWTASRFREAYAMRAPESAASFDLTEVMPTFAPSDTGRILARTRNRAISLGRFVYGYTTIPSLYREDISTVEPFISAFDGPAFEEERFEMAKARGLENDPEAKALLEEALKRIMVEHLYQDSVLNRVNVTPETRRRYYKDHQKDFMSYNRARYARFLRSNLAETDALIARLESGEQASRIMEADSLRGDDSTGVIAEMTDADHSEYKKLLFEELRPGKVAKIGPDQRGQYLVFQSLAFEPSRQLAYEEVQNLVDESMQNIESERILKEFLARRRKHFRIETHPELLMKIEITDPSRDLVWSAQ